MTTDQCLFGVSSWRRSSLNSSTPWVLTCSQQKLGPNIARCGMQWDTRSWNILELWKARYSSVQPNGKDREVKSASGQSMPNQHTARSEVSVPAACGPCMVWQFVGLIEPLYIAYQNV